MEEGLDALVAEAPQPELAAVLAGGEAPVRKERGAFRRRAGDGAVRRAALDAGVSEGAPAQSGPERAPSAAALARRKRAVVAKVLSDWEDPLKVLADNMTWAIRKAHKREKLMDGVEDASGLKEVVLFREIAQGAAVALAPYLHSKLAPKVPAGEKGLTVNFVIEDA